MMNDMALWRNGLCVCVCVVSSGFVPGMNTDDVDNGAAVVVATIDPDLRNNFVLMAMFGGGG